MINVNLAELFRKYQVTDVHTVEEFLRRYYKADRFRNEDGFNANREERLIANYTARVAADGWTFISGHDSVTGKDVSFYN